MTYCFFAVLAQSVPAMTAVVAVQVVAVRWRPTVMQLPPFMTGRRRSIVASRWFIQINTSGRHGCRKFLGVFRV